MSGLNLIVLLLLGSRALAQESPVELSMESADATGRSNEGSNAAATTSPGTDEAKPRVLVPVRIVADGMLAEVDAVGVDCELHSSILEVQSGDNVTIASGFAVAIRQGRQVASFVDTNAANEQYQLFSTSDSVDITFVIPFHAEDDAAPIEFWTDGECQLYLYRGSDSNAITPETCTTGDFAPPYTNRSELDRMLGCVWPGTDPASSYVTFARPGLEGLNPSTGGLLEPALTPHAEEEDE